jgi:hypothetical protein
MKRSSSAKAAHKIEAQDPTSLRDTPPPLPKKGGPPPLPQKPSKQLNDNVIFRAPINKEITRKMHEKIAQHLASKGIRLKQVLTTIQPQRSGQKGTTFEVSNSKILKVTTDESEALASLKVMRIKPPLDALTHYDDIFRFKSVSGDYLYGILQEKLSPPSALYERMAEEWGAFRNQGFVENKKKFGHYGSGKDYDRALKQFETPITIENIAAFVKWMDAKYRMQTMEEAQIAEFYDWLVMAAEALKKVGIVYRDLKGDNIMRRANGEHVIIDLGFSKNVGLSPNDIEEISAAMVSVVTLPDLLDALADRISMASR